MLLLIERIVIGSFLGLLSRIHMPLILVFGLENGLIGRIERCAAVAVAKVIRRQYICAISKV
jgi:hypothetical protein